MAEQKGKIDWPDLVLGGLALLIEALAIMFGILFLTVGAAVLFWLALYRYRKEGGKRTGWKLGTVSAILLVGVTTLAPIGIKKRYFDERPKLARLEFVFYPNLVAERQIQAVMNAGTVSVDFNVHLIGEVTAKTGSLWLRICNDCKYATEPTMDCSQCNRFVSGGSEFPNDRSVAFNYLFPKVILPRMNVEVTPPPNSSSFDMAFWYACENCELPDPQNPQKVTVSFKRQW